MYSTINSRTFFKCISVSTWDSNATPIASVMWWNHSFELSGTYLQNIRHFRINILATRTFKAGWWVMGGITICNNNKWIYVGANTDWVYISKDLLLQEIFDSMSTKWVIKNDFCIHNCWAFLCVCKIRTFQLNHSSIISISLFIE